ncbi:hypothetical protein [Ramlibacter pallidus]|uniref:Uncharacterized protein n=1 Tax=Ramlibacter pallidus TaxID=2780087 RepID=A0ABR9RZG8_9BURK|nr:hypothetical protein [Ramlibacter pallidus]MBE7366212.1 hypothetical protein [Ramlibacter pallidus]
MKTRLQNDYRMLRLCFAAICALFLFGLASGVALNISGNREIGEQVFRVALWACAVAFLVYVFLYWRLCRELKKGFIVWVVLWAIFLPFAFLYSFFAMRGLVTERLETVRGAAA